MSKTKKDKDGKPLPLVPFFLRGNFRPLSQESSYSVNRITHGSVPTDLNGTWLYNTANPYFPDTDTNRSHWFAGDGMLHAITLDNGKLHHCNRYTQTNKLLLEKAKGKKVVTNLQDLTEEGTWLAVIDMMKQKQGLMPKETPRLQTSTANTALVQHAKRIFALVEVDHPFEVKVEGENDGFEVRSVGYDTFNGQLKHAASAHSKADRRTDELFVFAADQDRAEAYCTVFDENRRLKSSFSVPLSSTRMIHEFLITEKYAVIPDLPLEIDPLGAIMQSKFIVNFNKTGKSRFGIVPRYSKTGADVKWFEVEPHYTFHFGSAWDAVDEQGHETVTVYAVTW